MYPQISLYIQLIVKEDMKPGEGTSGASKTLNFYPIPSFPSFLIRFLFNYSIFYIERIMERKSLFFLEIKIFTSTVCAVENDGKYVPEGLTRDRGSSTPGPPPCPPSSQRPAAGP